MASVPWNFVATFFVYKDNLYKLTTKKGESIMITPITKNGEVEYINGVYRVWNEIYSDVIFYTDNLNEAIKAFDYYAAGLNSGDMSKFDFLIHNSISRTPFIRIGSMTYVICYESETLILVEDPTNVIDFDLMYFIHKPAEEVI
jgi:hypothetical protein